MDEAILKNKLVGAGETYAKLIDNLQEMIRVYRTLLDTVRHEKDILVSARLDELNENNRSKEAMLIKARGLEQTRIKLVSLIAKDERLTEPSLLALALHYEGERGDELRRLHSVLVLLLRRVQELNKQNEILVRSALETVTGAMHQVREGLADKSTYKRGGAIDRELHETGHMVRREI
jgi:flagellar biosynthesis/type III secretory pathway chaperone